MTEPAPTLRALGFVTRMQPKYAAFEAAVVDGDIPIVGMAQVIVEVAPGNAVYAVTDAALKGTQVRPGSMVVEREFGYLELHAESPEDVREAARLILERIGARMEDRLRPRVVSTQLITNITAFHSQLINRARQGSLVIPGQTVLVLEVTPAAYVVVAANEAERSAPIDIVDIRPIGRFGRLYLSGEESHVREAASRAIAALEGIDGRVEVGG